MCAIKANFRILFSNFYRASFVLINRLGFFVIHILKIFESDSIRIMEVDIQDEIIVPTRPQDVLPTKRIIAVVIGLVLVFFGAIFKLFSSPELFLFTIVSVFGLLIVVIVFVIIISRRYARTLAGQLTEKLFSSREWFRELYDNGPVPYIVLSSNGHIRQPNKAALRLYGATANELYDKDFSDFFVQEDISSLQQYMEFFKRNVPVSGKELRIIRVDKVERWVLLSIYAIPGSKGREQYGLVTLVDITERKEVERAKTEFVSLASHQLRTPLATIKWHLGVLLAGDMGVFDEKQTKYLKKVYKGNQRLIDLVNLLLNVTRAEMGTLSSQSEEVDLIEVSEGVFEEYAPQISEKRLVVEKDYQKDLPCITTDSKLTRIIFQNFISNAIKYTSEGGNMTVRVFAKEDFVSIEVSDTGYGIPLEAQDKIFTKMFRADNAKKVDTKGIGLGLYMTKSIVETLGGTINFESELGRGTTFYVLLPQSCVPKAP